MKTSVWVEPRTKPDTYSIRYYDPATGEKKRVKAESKEEKKKKVNEIEAMLISYKPGSGGTHLTPLVVFEQYLTALVNDADRPRRKGTIRIKRESLTKFLEGIFHMGDITTPKIQAWRSILMSQYGVDSVSIKLRDLRAFLAWCTKRGILRANPFVEVNIPISSFVGRRLNLNELQSIYNNLSDYAKAFVDINIATGARLGEILALEWVDLDFERNYWLLPGREGKSKGRRDRIIPLLDRAVKAIKSLPQTGQYVFQGYNKNSLYASWRLAKRRAKITGRVRFHDLRHTWASNFQGRRSSLKEIAGWSTDVMLNRYKHTEIEELREDLEKSKFGATLGLNGAKE